jgi:putative heme-binding domain-containing protein
MRCSATMTFCLAVALLVSASPVSAQVKTQLPEVQESVVQSDNGEATPATPKPKPKTLDVSGGPAPVWIWAKAEKTPQACWLRKEFETIARSGAVIATCDNGMEVFLNDKRILSSSEWGTPVKADVSKHLKQGRNVFRVNATNEGRLAGFALKLVMNHGEKSKSYLISDSSWEASLSKDFSKIVDTTTHGKMGVGPWGNVFSKPTGGGGLVSSVPRNVFQLLPGFQVEKLYDVDKNTEGSWVSMTFDDQGRIIASDQGGKGLYRITPSPIGSGKPTVVEKLKVSMTSAHGMLFAFGSLYVSANGGPGSGLYRMTDTTGDDQYDKVEKLKAIQGGGEHGPHALRLSPDGKSIYLIAGNHTNPPEKFDHSRVPSNWKEDLLLPRQWDARGHARGKLAPGGWIAKTDPDGKTWEIISTGYRNAYDMDFNTHGELFAFDADMEWDMGSPWYRPTRLCHAVSGSDFGWRSGTGKWPEYYVDSLPPVVDIGPGSPVGVAFGTGAKFPQKYREALFCCDWTFGTMYAVHLKEAGASYVGVREEFLSRTPLPLTDVEIGPDGAMYFTTGGRGAQSALFRVTYTREIPPPPDNLSDSEHYAQRELRKVIEQRHRAGSTDDDVLWLWAMLGDEDRHIRYAARVALEHADPKLWENRVLDEPRPNILITASVALARQGSKESARAITVKLAGLDFASLTESQQLDLVRALSLVFIRLGEPDAVTAAAIAKSFDAHYPAKSTALNRELVQLLVYLNSPTVIDKTLKLLAAEDGDSAYDWTEVLARNGGYGGPIAKIIANMPDLNKAHYAFALRNMKYGWTLEQRQAYLAYYKDAASKSGGASYQGFLQNAQKDWLALASETERKALAGQISLNAPKEEELPKPFGPGKEWSMAELLKLSGSGVSGRDYEKGRRAYAASRCISCHRFGGEGGSTGPDLTNVAGRFSYKDLLEATVLPSKVISDQYRASIIETKKGQIITGRLLGEADGKLTILTDPVDITKTKEIAKDDVEEITPSPTSLMPEKLLHPMNREEILDLIAYLMSRGNPEDPVFK